MKKEEKLIRFDWAIKSMLRDKSNYDILEGFLSSLLKDDIKILNILESESNSEEGQKFNRVDILVEDGKGGKIIIEIQNQREADYIERLLCGASKVVVESLSSGNVYKDVAKVISISILYFNLGTGDDYIYYGNTEFKGMHTGKSLIVREKVKVPGETEKITYPIKGNIFPEYYLIRVNSFDDNVKEDMDEWVYMLKHSEIKEEFKSKNIKKAEEKLNLLKMNKEERKRYERYLENMISEIDIMETAREEGIEKGENIKGIKMVRKLLKRGMKIEDIAEDAEMTVDQVRKIESEIVITKV